MVFSWNEYFKMNIYKDMRYRVAWLIKRYQVSAKQRNRERERNGYRETERERERERERKREREREREGKRGKERERMKRFGDVFIMNCTIVLIIWKQRVQGSFL